VEELDRLALALGGRTRIRTVPLGCEGGGGVDAQQEQLPDSEDEPG
jgi:hypothetical protein